MFPRPVAFKKNSSHVISTEISGIKNIYGDDIYGDDINGDDINGDDIYGDDINFASHPTKLQVLKTIVKEQKPSNTREIVKMLKNFDQEN